MLRHSSLRPDLPDTGRGGVGPAVRHEPRHVHGRRADAVMDGRANGYMDHLVRLAMEGRT